MKSSEFYLTVLILIAASVLLGIDKIDQQTWALAVGIQGAGYAVSRGLAKHS